MAAEKPIHEMDEEERRSFLFGMGPKMAEILPDGTRFILWVIDDENECHFACNFEPADASDALRTMADNLDWSREQPGRLTFEGEDD